MKSSNGLLNCINHQHYADYPILFDNTHILAKSTHFVIRKLRGKIFFIFIIIYFNNINRNAGYFLH